EQSLQDSINEGVRSAGAAIQPVVEATMAGLRKDTTVLHEAITHTTQQQLNGLSHTFEQGSVRMLEGVSTQLETTVAHLSDAWSRALASQQSNSERLATDNQQALTAAVSTLEQQAVALVSTMGESHRTLQSELAGQDEKRLQVWTDTLSDS